MLITFRTRSLALLSLAFELFYDLFLSISLIFFYNSIVIQVGCFVILEAANTVIQIYFRPLKQTILTRRTIAVRFMFLLIGIANLFIAFSPEDSLYSLAILLLCLLLMFMDMAVSLYIVIAEIYTFCKKHSPKVVPKIHERIDKAERVLDKDKTEIQDPILTSSNQTKPMLNHKKESTHRKFLMSEPEEEKKQLEREAPLPPPKSQNRLMVPEKSEMSKLPICLNFLIFL